MIISDYHVHTTFSDGSNSPEEMIESAVKKGLKEIGFSEHAYEPFDKCRMEKGEEKKYRAEIKRLKEKYRGVINVLCGVEADYYSEDDFSAYDYVIGSVHYLKIGGKVYPVDCSASKTAQCIQKAFGGDAEGYAEAYFEHVAALKDRTEADIIGHFDLLTKFERSGIAFKDGERYKKASGAAVKALAGRCVFEINTGGICRGYKSRVYPSDEILTFIKASGGQAVAASDAHCAENIAASFGFAEEKATEFGFNELGFTDKRGEKHIQII